MTDTLLKTKLYAPIARPDLMARPSLVAHLRDGEWRPFTLISAPAGFGKTTFVGEWIRQSNRPAAWISLDSLDSDPSRFLSYVVGALQEISPGIGQGVLEGLFASSSLASVLPTLINQIAAVPDEFTLVLDDYHVITNMEIHEFVESLLDNLPPQMHLVIMSRADPPVPLSRLRARGQITELREADLKFTREEAHTFLNAIVGVDISPEDIDALEDRTEGWIAGLQMAALSMRGREDVSGFVAAFAGDDRHILDFLVEEVLEGQSEDVQNFLLRTSALERLTGGLCDAVTGGSGGGAMLRHIERDNLFIIPLDDRREWYRYHHLFADMLQVKLAEDAPNWGRTAHRQASEWYEAEGLVDEAANYAIEAEDLERAADLYEAMAQTVLPGFIRNYSVPEIRRLSVSLRQLPTPLIRTRPYLGILYAWGLTYAGRTDEASARLQDAERALTGLSHENLVPSNAPDDEALSDDERIKLTLGQIAFLQMIVARTRGEFDSALEISNRALSILPQPSRLHSRVSIERGTIFWFRGDVVSAFKAINGVFEDSSRSESDLISVGASADLARIQVLQGRLRDALRTYERALKDATERGAESSHITVDVLVAIGDVFRECNKLEDAERYVESARVIIDSDPSWVNRNHQLLALARLKRSRGDIDAAIDLITQAEQLPVGSGFSARISPPSAFKVCLLLDAGNLEEAVRWAEASHVTLDDDPEYLSESEHIALARVEIARHSAAGSIGSLKKVLGLLDRLIKSAEEDARYGSVIELLVIQALAHQASENSAEALSSITLALELGEPEGYVRIFVDEGGPMRSLLETALDQGQSDLAHGIAIPYVTSLLVVFDTGNTIPDSSNTPQAMPEPTVPLSAREIEVVRLIVAGETNQEIADDLVITLDTVKRHVTHIYRKLDVGRRPQAIARAREMGLS